MDSRSVSGWFSPHRGCQQKRGSFGQGFPALVKKQMAYRSRESYHAKTPEGIARQRAGLKRGRQPGTKAAPVISCKLPDANLWLAPVASAESLLGVRLWAKQRALLEAIRENSQVACRSANA